MLCTLAMDLQTNSNAGNERWITWHNLVKHRVWLVGILRHNLSECSSLDKHFWSATCLNLQQHRNEILYFHTPHTTMGWLDGMTIRTSDFTAGLVAIKQQLLASSLSKCPCVSVTKKYNLAPAKGRLSAAEKVTVGLASYPPCITDLVVYRSTGSTA